MDTKELQSESSKCGAATQLISTGRARIIVSDKYNLTLEALTTVTTSKDAPNADPPRKKGDTHESWVFEGYFSNSVEGLTHALKRMLSMDIIASDVSGIEGLCQLIGDSVAKLEKIASDIYENPK